MADFFSLHPYLEAAAIVFGVWLIVPLAAAGVLSAGGLLGRAGLSATRAYAAAAVLFAAAFLGAEFLPLHDRQAAVYVALVGGAGVTALGAGFRSRHAERAEEYGMEVSEGLFTMTLTRDRAGVRSRLLPKQGGGRDDSAFHGYNTRRTPNDVLDIETAVPALGQIRLIARWDGQLPEFVPLVLREHLPDLLDRSLPPLVERAHGDALASWPGRWRFRESAPGAAARILGGAAPPLIADRRLSLESVEIRDGLLRCRYERSFITADAIADAEEAVQDFAARLTGAAGARPA